MTLNFDQIRQTDMHLAVLIRRLCFRPTSLLLFIVLLSPFAAEDLLKHDMRPLVLALCVLGFALWVAHRFIADKLTSNDIPAEGCTTAEMLSFHMLEHLCTKNELTPATLLAAATESARGQFVLHQIDIEGADIVKAVQANPITESLETVLEWIKEASTRLCTNRLDSTATIYAFFTHLPSLTPLLNKADVSETDLLNILRGEAFHFYVQELKHKAWSPEALVRTMGSIGRSWVIGYNNNLERLTTNISERVMSRRQSVVIHGDALQSVLKPFFAGARRNVLILGPSGSGKRTLVANMAFALRMEETTKSKAFTDVLSLRTPMLLSGGGVSDQVLLKALENALEGGRFILVIEDLALLLKAADARLKEIIVHVLQAKNISTVCVADTADYHTLIKNDPQLDQLLEKTYLNEAEDDEVMAVLLEEYFILEKQRRTRMTYKALRAVLDLSKQYIGRGAMPGKAVDVLRDTVTRARGAGQKTIRESDVRETISRRTRIDIRALGVHEKDVLMHLEERLKSRIVGQAHVIDRLVDGLKRARFNLHTRTRPLGTFLFLGTTGVGKTETAKALADEYFGSTDCFIRVDMNECSEESSIRTLIGGQTNGGFTEGFLTRRVQDRPFSLILLDEVEKAHISVLHLFLQILDEGVLIDGQGQRIDFRNTIIIATSNAGSRWIGTQGRPETTEAREALREATIKQIVDAKTFSPEFINRFDEVIVFAIPSRNEVEQLAILMLDGIIKEVEKTRGIKIRVEPAVIGILVDAGYDPSFGAREMRRTVGQKIETYLANIMLTNMPKRGDEILISAADIGH